MTDKKEKTHFLQKVKKQFRPISDYRELLFPFGHSTHIKRHRAQIIASRVGLLSLLFALLIPLWIAVDFFAFEWPTWAFLAIMRIASAGVFLWLYFTHETCKTLNHAYLLLMSMMAVPPVFYLISQPFLLQIEMTMLGQMITEAYGFLPLIVVAGLCIFPLTTLEVSVAGLLAIIAIILGSAQQPDFNIQEFITSLWLMLLVLGAAVFSGMSQLHYMIRLINQATKDLLTGAYTRRSGEEYLDLQFRISLRTDTAMSVLFIDVDKFKTINDEWGHEKGDEILQQVARRLADCLRKSDQLIRWGGEEFLIILPNTDVEHTIPVLKRLQDFTLGFRPDNTPVTVSIGISELKQDLCEDWTEMVEKADQRMYRAKNNGRNQSVGPQPTVSIEKLIA